MNATLWAENKVLAAIFQHALVQPEKIALRDAQRQLTYAQLQREIDALANWLCAQGISRLALWGENSIEWVIADLACWQAEIPLVPLPRFFSPAQLAHVLDSAGIEQLLCCGEISAVCAISEDSITPNAGIRLQRLARTLNAPAIALPEGTRKITYTSGTTAQPKGVCLSTEAMSSVSAALVQRIYQAESTGELRRHLCFMPLSTLLENIAGIYVPLSLGKEVVVLAGAELGLSGSSQLQLPTLLQALHQYQPNSLILLPQILHALVLAGESVHSMPASLRFVAVGGAPTPLSLLKRAKALGLPVFEGYGLSECASVVALNAPGQQCVGSVGKVLDHVRLRIQNGEIWVRGNSYLGYLGQPPETQDSWLDTGDLGHLDSEGFLHITGRAKNLIITSFGRNLAPEWLESELMLCPGIAQAMVLGDGQAFCSAIIVPRPGVSAERVREQIAVVNTGLPDYARIAKFIVRAHAFSPADQSLTDNGRLRRANIYSQHAQAIAQLYQPQAADELGELHAVF